VVVEVTRFPESQSPASSERSESWGSFVAMTTCLPVPSLYQPREPRFFSATTSFAVAPMTTVGSALCDLQLARYPESGGSEIFPGI